MLKNDIGARDLGKAYALQAPEHLSQRLAGPPALHQFAMFHASAIAWMAAQAFTTILEKGGIEDAQQFLALMNAGTTAAIRLKGAPYMVTMSSELAPVDEEVAGSTPPCECSGYAREKAGDCPTCPKVLQEEYQGFVTSLVDHVNDLAAMNEVLSKICVPCGAKYADEALAKIVKAGITSGPEPEPVKQQAVAIALQTITLFGVNQAPLTVAALQERQG